MTWYCSICFEDQEGDCMGMRDEKGAAICAKCQAVGHGGWEGAR